MIDGFGATRGATTNICYESDTSVSNYNVAAILGALILLIVGFICAIDDDGGGWP